METALYQMKDDAIDLKGFYGSKLYIADHGFVLVIAYDDMDSEDMEQFGSANLEIIFKQFGQAAIFLFDFQGYLLEASFDLFANHDKWAKWTEREHGNEIPLEILICDSTTGRVLKKRQEVLSNDFCAPWLRLVNDRYKAGLSDYSNADFKKQIADIYDNHTVDELYALHGEQTVMCRVV